jgi:hypothetical protein
VYEYRYNSVAKEGGGVDMERENPKQSEEVSQH